ncbi:MAG: STELLO glycosyltransferase family protein [Bryobacteraceae bacterium]
MSKTALVVTSISGPKAALRELAQGCRDRGMEFYLIGDTSSPADFQLAGCRFFSISRQQEVGLRTAALCPKRHYARKNIGYLLAIRDGAELILETDDDNRPRSNFWNERSLSQTVVTVRDAGWLNVYAYFTGDAVWPRGLPLDSVRSPIPVFETLSIEAVDCPIQQGLADGNPDVDAVFRLLFPLPIQFRAGRKVALGRGTWCPFNSQNTAWWPDAYPLLYLPAYCSFRMTDIWRSLIAQRIAWMNGWMVLFHEASVWQQRNEHDLMRDFEDEIPGYLYNRKIAEVLDTLSLSAGIENTPNNLRLCYEELVRQSLLEARELPLLEAWLQDLSDSEMRKP